MSVVVYPRLAELLKERNLTVAELERQIKERFGLAVNPKTLYRLTQAAPVQRAEQEIAQGEGKEHVGVEDDDARGGRTGGHGCSVVPALLLGKSEYLIQEAFIRLATAAPVLYRRQPLECVHA